MAELEVVRTGSDEWTGAASWSCGAGANTSSRRKAWVGGPGLASRPIAVTITVTTESGAAESGTSSHRLPQADSFGSRQTLERLEVRAKLGLTDVPRSRS